MPPGAIRAVLGMPNNITLQQPHVNNWTYPLFLFTEAVQEDTPLGDQGISSFDTRLHQGDGS